MLESLRIVANEPLWLNEAAERSPGIPHRNGVTHPPLENAAGNQSLDPGAPISTPQCYHTS